MDGHPTTQPATLAGWLAAAGWMGRWYLAPNLPAILAGWLGWLVVAGWMCRWYLRYVPHGLASLYYLGYVPHGRITG